MVVRGGYIFYEAEGTDGRLNFNFIPFRVSETLTAAANTIPTRACRLLARRAGGSSLGSVTWVPLRSRQAGTRSALEPGLPAAAVQSHRTGARLCRHDRRPSDRGREHQPAARRPGQRAGAPALPAVRQPVGADAGAVERLPGAADEAAAAAVNGALVSRLVYLLRATRRVPAPEIGGNYTYETQPQPWDIPHLFAASYGYELPFGKGRKFLSNGRAGQRHRRRLAVPEHHQLPQRACRSRRPSPRRRQHRRRRPAAQPDRLGRAGQPDDRRMVRQDRVRRPRQFHVRRLGTGILRSDHQWNVDMSLFKRFDIRTGQTLEFRAEAFNVLNSVYFNAPNTNIDTAAGGVTARRTRRDKFSSASIHFLTGWLK